MESTGTFTSSFLQGLGFGTGVIVAAGTAVFVMGNAFLFYKSNKNENSSQTQEDLIMEKTQDTKLNATTPKENNVFKQMFDDLE